MLTDQEKSEQIERYLAGEMPGPERQAFEAVLRDDPALSEMLALHRAMAGSLGNRQRRQLLDALADVVEQAENKRPAAMRVWLSPFRMAAAAAVLVLVAAVGAWFYLQPRVEPPAVAEQPAPRPLPGPDSVQPTAPHTPAGRAPDPGPLAAADRRAFAPNRALDPMAGTQVRGGNAELSIAQPEPDALLPLRNGKIDFHLKGRAAEMTTLVLHIYNNSEADFAAGKFVFSADLSVQGQVFTYNTKIKLAPGRYYVVLSAPDEEEPLAVLRFFAGSR